MSGTNTIALKAARVKIREATKAVLNEMAERLGRSVSDHIKQKGTYSNITGNTRGSIAFGVYYDGKLLLYDTPFKADTERKTLLKGEEYKGFTGTDGDSRYYGFEESVRFLKTFTPSVRKGFEIVFAVGTNYAEYVESTRNKNVMKESFQYVRAMGKNLLFPNELPFEEFYDEFFGQFSDPAPF